jgi:hypothetical protein
MPEEKEDSACRAHTSTSSPQDALGQRSLLACPFCRRPAGLHMDVNVGVWWHVQCTECGARGGKYATPERAADEWNRRGCFSDERPAITEDWLSSVGFKWEQLDRQPSKHWILWLGRALRDYADPNGRMFCGPDDIGVELAAATGLNLKGIQDWFCWLRSDVSHRYGRFVHVRHLVYQDELIAIVEALTGYPWIPENHRYGQVWLPEAAERLREESQRLDKVRDLQVPWDEYEKDESRGRPTHGHLKGAIEGGKAK